MIARTASCKVYALQSLRSASCSLRVQNEIEKVQKLDFQYYKPHQVLEQLECLASIKSDTDQESLGEGIVISTSSSILSSESVESHHLLKGVWPTRAASVDV